ncbi:hypothetical protein ACFLU6_11555 [Acidobacteriota bacterium]
MAFLLSIPVSKRELTGLNLSRGIAVDASPVIEKRVSREENRSGGLIEREEAEIDVRILLSAVA